jgi:hypothetical protein
MKKIYSLILTISISVSAFTQINADYGIMGGVTSYLGDINPGRLFYSPSPAGGIFYRYNFHPRQSLRADLIFGGLAANDLDFKNSFQRTRAASFSGTVGELALQFEFNFLPYSTQGKKWNYTPYVATGAGVAFVNTSASAFTPVIPFSVGFKVNIHKNLGLEAEYGFRKTFYDNFDGLKDLTEPSPHALLHNNDWYSYAGIAFTWKFFNKLAGCPAFTDVDEQKKH